MVEVFKTNVTMADDARQVVRELLMHFPEARINIDLEDCDRVLRVENANIDVGKTVTLVNVIGYQCEVLG